MTEGRQRLIQKLRLQHGWSQEQLAELSGLSVRTIQRLERGQTPSVESLKSIAAVLDVDFTTLKEPAMDPSLSENAGLPPVRADEALALAHVRRIKGFYLHCAQYALVITILALANLLLTPRYYWFVWPALGWGSGLLLHGLRTFDKIPFLTGQWERSQVEKYLGRKL